MKSRYPLVVSGLFISVVLLIFAGTVSAMQNGFTPGCSLDAIKKKRPIDAQCGPEGEGDAANRKQNSAKNNLCASGTAIPITISVFDDLQQAAEEKEMPFGNQHIPHHVALPEDRSVLKDLVQTGNGKVGEGSKTVFVAFISRTKAGEPESVNCHVTKDANNDIHIVLARRFADTDECSSVTAEMIPHFRPTAWDKIRLQTVMAKLGKHPARITGQAFFDASHSPCGHPEFRPSGDPKRRSLWEIHPIYAIDVCKNKTLAGCKIDKESVWTPFHEWVQHPQ